MQSKRQGSFSARMNRAFVLPFALLAVLAGVLLLEINSLRDSMQWIDHTDQVIGKSRNLLRHVIEMESGLRGFQLTGNEEFLQTYKVADTAVDSDFRDLNELVAHNPGQRQRLEREGADYAQWKQYAVQTITRRRNGEDTSSYAENIEGKRLMDTFHEDRDAFTAEAKRLRDERVQRAKRVSDLVFSSSVLLTFGIGGLVIFLTRRQMVSLVRSFQEAAEAAEQRAAELERLSAIVESSEDAIIGMALDDTITSWNRGAERLYGYSATEVLGRPMGLIMPPEKADHLTDLLQRVARGERVEPHECIRRKKDGTVVDVSVVISPIRGRGGTIVGASSIARDITERKQMQAERGRLRVALSTAQEDTARQIARELHDDVAQRLALLSMEIGKTVARRPAAEELITELRSHQAKVLDISKSIREISHQMHPAILDDLGLSAALESMCLDLQRVEGTRVHFEARDIPDHLDRALGSCLFRVCQESLRNISKHAHAKNVSVLLVREDESLRLEVLDSGVGFDCTEQRSGLGTYSIQERLRMVNGAVRIESQPGHGTRVIARVPLKGGALESHPVGN